MSTARTQPASNPGVPPRLRVDGDEIRLTSPRGDVAGGAVALVNSGGGMLEGVAAVRVGSEWLRVAPTVVRLAPGETGKLEVRADPSGLPSGYTVGEVEIVTNGGTATLSVRLGVRARRSWGILLAAVVLSVLVAAVVGVALARVQLPAASRARAPHTVPAGQHTGARSGTHRTGGQAPAFDRAAALAALRQAIVNSYAVWQSALTLPSPSALPSVETGSDLQQTSVEARDLVATGAHWDIKPRRFQVLSGTLSVSDDGGSGSGEVQKVEARALYGPDHPRTPYEAFDDTYHLRYHLVRQGGRWLVDGVTVLGVTPVAQGSANLSVQAVAARVLPVVAHIEADSATQTAVGTGIIIRSSAHSSDVITNDHVVAGANTVKIQRWIGTTYTSPLEATRVWEDAGDDLAVVRIPHGNLPVAAWGDSQSLQPGQDVVAIGYAENLDGGPTVTTGIVSSLHRPVDGQDYIGHSATINHGNSGGPLVDMAGRVVGINARTLDNTQGLFFAIPSSRALPIAAGWVQSNG